MNKSWACLTVSERYNKPMYYMDIINSIKEILPQAEIKCVGNNLGENLYENSVENYIFVKHPSFETKKDQLKDLKYLEKHNKLINVYYISDQEIEDLTTSCEKETKKIELTFGDIVKIRNGKYKNLTGIIVDVDDDEDTCDILFKFWFGIEVASLPMNNMLYQDNLFNIVKFPKVKDE